MYCNKCGKEIREDASFCDGCGQQVNLVKKEVTQKPISTTNKLLYRANKSVWEHKGKIIICLILAVMSIIMALAEFTAQSPSVGLGAVMIAIALIFIIPIIIIYIGARKNEILIYEKIIIVKKGIINTKESQSIMTPIIGVSVSQTLNGKIYNYGTVKIDKIGTGWNIDTKYIKKPHEFKKFLEKLMMTQEKTNTKMFITN